MNDLLDYFTPFRSFLAGLGLGSLVIAVLSKAFSDLITDKRREWEKRKEEKESFRRLAEQMPDLIANFRAALKISPFARRFTVFPDHKSMPEPDSIDFAISATELKNVHAHLDMLHDKGYITEDLKPGWYAHHRMYEHFVELLRK